MNIFTKFLKTIIITFLILAIGNIFRIESMTIIPVALSAETAINPIVKKLNVVGIKVTDKLVDAIAFASKQHKRSPDLIIATLFTESSGNKDAESSKGYHGYMMIPQKVYYADANILIGCQIFSEKMVIAKGDVEKAICLYKGYPLGSEDGKKQVKKVLTLYHKIKEETT